MKLRKHEKELLQQLLRACPSGVWCGDLISKPVARDLVALGMAHNSGGSPSSLDNVSITDKGRDALKTGNRP